MTDAPRPSNKPFCMRLNEEERKKLEQAASGVHLSKYIKSILFGRDLPQITRRSIKPVKDHHELAKLLALLGQSRIASNINQLAKAANSGSLPVNADVLRSLDEAARSILTMRSMLMKALGFKEKQDN